MELALNQAASAEQVSRRASRSAPDRARRTSMAEKKREPEPSPEDALDSAERDALLGGLRDGDKTASGPAASWRPIDFRRQRRKLGREELASLHEAPERFAASAADELGLLLRVPTRISLVSEIHGDFAQFAHGLPQPAALYLVRLVDSATAAKTS